LNPAEWQRELESHAEFFARLGDRVPATLHSVRNQIAKRLPG
jgi:GTP-dependent phosphoenolpyruvate carboxykinase